MKPGRFLRRLGLLRLFIFFFVLALSYGGPQYLLQFQILPHIAKELRLVTIAGVDFLICVLTISLYGLLVGLLERRHIIELGLKRGLRLVVGGFVFAILIFAVVYGGLFAAKAASWQGLGTAPWLVAMAALALVSGVCEEVLFRGGIFRITEDMFGTGVALLISAALFGLAHLANPHASLLAAVAIAVEAGVLLGAVYAATRNLWLPIGIHIGWNFAEGGIFGAPISGSPGGHGLLAIPLQGPDWLTGGEFGPEASVVTIAVCSVVGLYFVIRTIRAGRWCRLGFRMLLD